MLNEIKLELRGLMDSAQLRSPRWPSRSQQPARLSVWSMPLLVRPLPYHDPSKLLLPWEQRRRPDVRAYSQRL